MKWDGQAYADVIKERLYSILWKMDVSKALTMSNKEYAAFLKSVHSNAYCNSSNGGGGVPTITGQRSGVTIDFENCILNNDGETTIELSWSMVARHIRAWEFEKANRQEDKQMAKKRSFDTAIINDIKSVAGDSFADNIKMLPVDQLHDNPENFYDLSDLDTLVEDIDRQGLKTPLYVVPDDDNGYTVISGHRRKAAVQELIDSGKYGTDKLPCYIGVKKNEAEIMLDLIMLNATTRVISDAETVKQCEKLEKVFKQLEADGKKVQGRMRDKIAAALNVSPAQVGKVENIRHNAIDEVKAAVNEGKMSISTANEVAKLEPKKQKDLIEKKKPEEITHKEIKNTVAAAKEKASPKKQAEEIIERLENNEDVSIEEINHIPDADLDYEGGYEDMTLDEYDKNSSSNDKAVIMPTAEEDAEMREKAKATAEAMKELWVKPPEYFNNIVDSGMCNSIISGYVLLILEEMGIERPSNILKIINSVLDFQNAQAARDKFSDN